MNVKDIQRYKNKSIPQLLKIAERHFNKFIRERDAGKGCISCNSRKVEHASHFYSAGNYSVHRFNPDNVHGSCLKCNTFLHGNLIEYRVKLIERIGQKKYDWLESTRHEKNKWERLSLIEIILKYK